MATYNNRVSNIYSGVTKEKKPNTTRKSEKKQIVRT